MSIKTNPTLLQGEWNVGYALDCHTLKSVPIGVNPFGRTQYDTTRSEIGELLYRFKYKSDYDCLEPIVDAAANSPHKILFEPKKEVRCTVNVFAAF